MSSFEKFGETAKKSMVKVQADHFLSFRWKSTIFDPVEPSIVQNLRNAFFNQQPIHFGVIGNCMVVKHTITYEGNEYEFNVYLKGV